MVPLNFCAVVFILLVRHDHITQVGAKFYVEPLVWKWAIGSLDEINLGKPRRHTDSPLLLFQCEGSPKDPALTAKQINCTRIEDKHEMIRVYNYANFYLVYNASLSRDQSVDFVGPYENREFTNFILMNIGFLITDMDGPKFLDDQGQRDDGFLANQLGLTLGAKFVPTEFQPRLAQFYAEKSAVSLRENPALSFEYLGDFTAVLEKITKENKKDLTEQEKEDNFPRALMVLRKMIDPCALLSYQSSTKYCNIYCKFISSTYSLYGLQNQRMPSKCSSLQSGQCVKRMCVCYTKIGSTIVNPVKKLSMVSCSNAIRLKYGV